MQRKTAGLLYSLGLVLSAGLPAQEARESARNLIETDGAHILADYAELLAMPNVANDRQNINRNASFIVGRLEEYGFETRLLRVDGAPPVVYAEQDTPGAEVTIGLYVHYDGQPADPVNWTTPPWEPVLYNGRIEDGGGRIEFPGPGQPIDPEWRLYARSASDDKAPLGALFPALEALRRADLRPSANIRILFEGEEEAGSPNLGRYVSEFRHLYDDVDLWVFLDGPMHQSRRPMLMFGVRGVTGMQVTLYGPARPLHSGHYGNWAPVPGQMLAELLATMKDDQGNVTIEGFYDSTDPIGPEERRALEELPQNDEELRHELALGWTEGDGESLAERILRPSLTIKGIQSGNVGSLARNVIPSTATAALGIRLARGNDPQHMQDLVESHIRSQGFHVVHSEPNLETRRAHRKVAWVQRGGGYPAARTSMNLPILQPVVDATRDVGGDPVMVPGLGGSLPLFHFSDTLGKPFVIVPIANHDNNQHAPDENLRIANLWYGIELYAHLLTMDWNSAR